MNIIELFPRRSATLNPVQELLTADTAPLYDWSVKPRPMKILQTELGPVPELIDPADRAFWGDYPPLGVVIATGSIRKAWMFARQLTQLRFSEAVTVPLELQAYLEANIGNANQSFKGRVLLGYLHGVPVFAETQDGETPANDDPAREAVNKVRHVYQKYQHLNILVISTDTVDKPDSSPEPIGKPMYRPDYPQTDMFEDRDQFWALRRAYKDWTHQLPRQIRKQLHDEIHAARPRRRGHKEEQLAQAEQAYLNILKYSFFAVGTKLLHTNAVAILDGLLDELSVVKKVHLHAEVTATQFDAAKPKKDSAGAGILQDLVNWQQEPTGLIEFGDEFTQQVFNQLPPEILPWALYCTITGSPFWQMKRLLGEASRRRQGLPPPAPVESTRRPLVPSPTMSFAEAPVSA
jgi:hypothetical protein